MVASLRAGWRWWRTLSDNPIYQRELDTWGSANPFYASLRRYLPLLILLGLVLGVCTTVSSPTLFANNELMSTVYCLLCLPGMAINFVTIYGLFTAPALTAPMISAERYRGTWQLLLTTPQSRRSIVMAKLMAALHRQRIWPFLILLAMFQASMMACVTMLLGSEGWQIGVLASGTTLLRPLIEVATAAVLGLTMSLLTTSAVLALVASYSAVILLKLFNSSVLWGMAASQVSDSRTTAFLASSLAPVLVYGLVSAVGFLLIEWQLRRDLL